MSSEKTTTPVEYRPVAGFPLYRVGNDGTLWSTLQQFGQTTRITDRWKRIHGSLDQDGYLVTTLRKELGGKSYRRHIHRLVLETFVGSRPKGMEARHNPDATRTNNALSNLSWGTQQANSDDRMRAGTQAKGSKNAGAKLTEKDIPAIRQLAGKMNGPQIARKFNISRSQVHTILKRKSWKHVP